MDNLINFSNLLGLSLPSPNVEATETFSDLSDLSSLSSSSDTESVVTKAHIMDKVSNAQDAGPAIINDSDKVQIMDEVSFYW